MAVERYTTAEVGTQNLTDWERLTENVAKMSCFKTAIPAVSKPPLQPWLRLS